MKNILILVTLIFISFDTKANVRTLEIGSLYYQCKPYQNVNFNFEKLSQSDQVKAMLCRTTLIGIVNTGYNLCQSLRWYYKKANDESKIILKGLTSWYANELVESENQLITGFNEWAEKNKHLWQEFVTGISFKRDHMAKNYYCNLK